MNIKYSSATPYGSNHYKWFSAAATLQYFRHEKELSIYQWCSRKFIPSDLRHIDNNNWYTSILIRLQQFVVEGCNFFAARSYSWNQLTQHGFDLLQINNTTGCTANLPNGNRPCEMGLLASSFSLNARLLIWPDGWGTSVTGPDNKAYMHTLAIVAVLTSWALLLNWY